MRIECMVGDQDNFSPGDPADGPLDPSSALVGEVLQQMSSGNVLYSTDVIPTDQPIGHMTAAIGVATSTGAGTDAAIVIDVGTGLFAETSTVVSSTATLENFIGGLSNGTFEIRDSSGTLLGTVSYDKTDSLLDLANNISLNVTDVSASVSNTGGTFAIEILHDARDAITFTADTDGLLSGLNLSNVGDSVYSANFGGGAAGGDDQSALVNGRMITALGPTNAEGLHVFYNGNTDLASAHAAPPGTLRNQRVRGLVARSSRDRTGLPAA